MTTAPLRPKLAPVPATTAQALATWPATLFGRFLPASQSLPPSFERDSYSSTALSEVIDRSVNATIARFTGALSPTALALAYMDWAMHLAMSPGKRTQLVEKAAKKWARFLTYVFSVSAFDGSTGPCIEPLPQDHRFTGDAWKQFPFNIISQGFLLQQQWWHNATMGIPGVTQQHEKEVTFATRQMLDVVAPSNFALTNPEILERTITEGGMNLVRGFHHYVEDMERTISGKPPLGAEAFKPGEQVAATPGKVVLQNNLIELIQYEPSTETVHKEPILIVPAWIMKYYILDLSAHNSLVRYLRDQGYTVFMISWKNPDPEDRGLGMEDYRKLGIMAAFNAISSIMPDTKVHATGYCLGGTLLSIAAAAMARDGDDRIKSLTLLASQTDFTEAGELTLFIDESQLDFLEDVMWEQGFLDTKQMSGAFQLLRSNDLIWSRVIHDYLMGERQPMNDLMAWNADATRLPYTMHSQYLRKLYLHNDLAEGRYTADGKPVTLVDIGAPIFAVGTEWDHVAPWRSAFRIQLLTETDVTFVLTNGGHNAGIVSEPGHHHRHFRVLATDKDALYIDPDTWLDQAAQKEGSWWPEWVSWLGQNSSESVKPPPIGSAKYPPLREAPGLYVKIA